MSIKPDVWIKRMAESEGMIEPFSENQVRVDDKGEKLISYGVSSFGYDVRCANEFKVFTNIHSATVDPKVLMIIALLISPQTYVLFHQILLRLPEQLNISAYLETF